MVNSEAYVASLVADLKSQGKTKTEIIIAAAEAEDVEVLGRYENGETAVARRGNDVWFAAPQLTPSILKSIFTAAGVHIWVNSGEPVMAGCGLVLLNSPKGGRRTIYLPDGTKITDELPEWTTALYDMQTHRRVL